MELIVISESKVKIMLSPPDMRRYQVSKSACAPAPGPGLRRLLDDIHSSCGLELREERLMVDLYTCESGCELFLTKLGPRPLPERLSMPESSTDPCTVSEQEPGAATSSHPMSQMTSESDFTTNFTTDSTTQTPYKTTDSPHGNATIAPPNGLTTAEHALLTSIRESTEEDDVVLCFSDLSDLLRLCRRLTATGFDGRSHVYIDEVLEGRREARWYLWLVFHERGRQHVACRGCLSEYAQAVDTDFARICRGEYWRVIAKDRAVETLGRLI